jgi:hypothetical protein
MSDQGALAAIANYAEDCLELYLAADPLRQVELLQEREALLATGIDSLPGEAWSVRLDVDRHSWQPGGGRFGLPAPGYFLEALRKTRDDKLAALDRGDIDGALALAEAEAPFIRFVHYGGLC